ncbi:aspartate/glutamate racemase family protein [Xanthobacter sediminis]
MTIRIWHQSVNELSKIGAYKQALETRAAAFLGADAQVTVQGMPEGTYGPVSPTEALGNAYLYHKLLSPIVEQAVAAEKEGYDAFVIGSYSEPFLREMRSAVDIPVVSLAEASVLLALSLGQYVGMITNAPNVTWMVKSALAKHKLEARVLEVVSLDPSLDEYELDALRRTPEVLTQYFVASASRLVAHGADVIIPAEGVMAEMLLGQGLKRVDGAVVVDVFAAAWAQALMLVRLWRGSDLRVGRAWQYRR